MAEVKRSVRLAGLTIIALITGTALLLTAETLFRFRPAYGRSGFSFDRNLIWRPTPNLSAAKAYAQGQATWKADCEKTGTKLVLMKIPTKSEFDGSYSRKTHDPLKIVNLADSLSAKYQIPLLNLNHQLKQETDPLFIFMHWEYHFNQAGHQYVGEQLCRFFNEELR